MKNQQTEKKIQKTLVQKNGIPIMRLHRHGGCESLHTNSRSVEEKNLLFNNLSDNLCGHSKIRILNVARRKMNTKSQE